MLLKAILATTLILFSNATMAKTQMSELVEYVQKKYADTNSSHKILVFDKDEVNWRFAKAKVFGEENEKKRIPIIQAYVKEMSGVELTSNQASNFDTYLSILKNSAVALPITEGYSSNKVYKICGVFHADANSNQRLETERLLGLKNKGAYGDLKYNHLKEKLELEEMREFSLYHELGHCLDKRFLPEAQSSYNDAHSIHESESFAETTGLLLLAREGILDVAQRRITMRNIYSRKIGQYLIDTPNISYGNPNAKYGGLIYYMEPVLTAGEALIEANPEFILSSSVEEILIASEKIVDESSLKSRSFNAIFSYLTEGAEVTLERYREYEASMPEFFVGIIDSIMSYIDKTDSTIEEAFNLDLPEVPFKQSLREFTVEEFCPSFKADDRESFNKLLDAFREDLKEENGLISEQRQRQQDLMELPESLTRVCD